MSPVSKTIVLVEDEQVLQKALSIELLDSGCTVLSASDGQAGLALIRKEKPSLVLLDIMLPKMNGFDVLAAMKTDVSLKNIPVIILSNASQEEERAKGMKLGALDYYVKSSTDLTELTKKIKTLVGS